MTPELAAEIVQISEFIGFEPAIYENYSGREMYGELTTGVVVNHDQTAWLMTLPTEWLATHDIDALRYDQLGKGYIIY